MFDFPIMPEVATKMSWTFSGLLYFMILALYNKRAMLCYSAGYGLFSENSNNKFFMYLIFIYCLCAFYCGDWAHLQTILKTSLNEDYVAGYGIEKVYILLNEQLNGNYLLFRTIVWGGGLICLYHSFKYAGINPCNSLFFLFGIYITSFAYSRAGCALAIFYLGFVLLFQSKENCTKLRLAIAISLIVASTFFHRSLLVLACLTPIALVPITNKNMPILLIGLFLFSFFASRLYNMVFGTLMASEEYAHRVEVYESIAGSNSITFNLNGLFYLWYKAIVHLPFWICIITLNKRIGIDNIPITIQAVFRFAIILYTFSIMMLFTYGSASAFYYRYEGMLYIPITIMMCFLKENKYIPIKEFRLVFWICAWSCGKDFIYRIVFM